MSFAPERLSAALVALRQAIGSPESGLCVALSGGLDSTVLLAALARLHAGGPRGQLRAIHVDHRLQADAERWSGHSIALARRCGVDCEVVGVDARAAPGESPEAAARAARYQALADRLRPGELLLTAHHADDQLETLLLQCLRGGGLRSLAGMRPVAPFARGWLGRPLLGFTRAELQAWGLQCGLGWIEDDSNLDTRFDRNYLRIEILPALRRRWPSAATTVGRVARHALEALELDDLAAEADLSGASRGVTLQLAGLRALPPPGQRRLLRAWLRARGLPPPPAATLEALRHDMLLASVDRVPEARWSGAIVRRYRDRLYATTQTDVAAAWTAGDWPPGTAFDLGDLGRLELIAARGVGLSRARIPGPLRVVTRPAGALFHPARSRHRRPLRKWLQERGVLPWLRAGMPCVVAATELVAVGDLACCDAYAAADDEESLRIEWRGRPVLTEAEATQMPDPH